MTRRNLLLWYRQFFYILYRSTPEYLVGYTKTYSIVDNFETLVVYGRGVFPLSWPAYWSVDIVRSVTPILTSEKCHSIYSFTLRVTVIARSKEGSLWVAVVALVVL